MGTANSTSQLADQIVTLLEQQGIGVKEETVKEFIKTLERTSPWFVHSGGLNIPDWEQVMRDLQRMLRRCGPESIPAATLSLWRLVKDALMSTNAKIRGQMSEIERTSGAAQDDPSHRSLQTSDSDQESCSEDEEGETSVEEIEVPKRKINKHRATERSKSRPPSVNPFFTGEGATAPPAYKPYSSLEWCCEDKATRRGVIFPEPPLGQGAAYPVVEVPDPNNAGQSRRQHAPLSFKELKNLKEAVSSYGPLAPFTSAIFESYVASTLTPGDWQQLCRAVLSGGDFLLWRGEFQEQCTQLARLNAQAGFPQRDLEMLTGTGQYATLPAQIQYDPAVYAQISTAAVKAWKALPNKAAGEQLSKVVQGPSEPFQEFADRLLQLAGKLFGDIDTAMPLVKQLAYENSNKWCKEVIRSHKNKSLIDYIRLCKEIDGNYVMGQVMAAAMRKGNGGTRACFRCGQPGHFKRVCPQNRKIGDSGLCPRCRKGHHWRSECRSKEDVEGQPLNLPGNGRRGPLRGPQARVYGAMNTPGVEPTQTQFIPQTNPFLSGPG
ncbi:endogenous retrovirus group K member 6 Gag polyprotein-like [Rattus rattus]|uniref:endogenous retrovirus group K member 6 Gag polyprotein-like n=1 Tax=Rattus rattus TaxID=10117 RepID=UPI0013F2F22C|nr:endogenous retrovirus group K member 6 Gag polyprotein-like [Rattus rattus]